MRNWESHFRSMKPSPQFSCGCDCAPSPQFGTLLPSTLLVSQNTDNLNSVNDYIHRTVAKTAKAKELQSDWVRWWESAGNPDLSWFPPSDLLWDEARNRRLAFDLANAVTAAETQAVKQHASGGMSSEQAQGEPDRRDPTTGTYYTPPPPPVPAWVKPVVIGALALGVGISALPLIRKVIFPI